MGNTMSSRRRPKRAAAPRKVKKPNRFSFGSRKNRGLQQQDAVAATPRKRFGFGNRRKAHREPKVVATKPKKRFGFGSKKAARHQPHESAGAPAAIQNIKAKISPSPAPVKASKRSRKQAKKNEATSMAKRFAPLAFAKAKASRKQNRHAPPPTAKRGFLGGLTSRNRRRY